MGRQREEKDEEGRKRQGEIGSETGRKSEVGRESRK